jgi:hypothetical protein
MTKEKLTTFQVTLETRDRLKSIGSKGETYDELINRLLDAEEPSDYWKRIGTIGVDSGLVMVGDPGYYEDTAKIHEDWGGFCKEYQDNAANGVYTIGKNGITAIVVPSGLGDGLYDVFAHFVGSRVGAVFVEFIAPDDEARVIKDGWQ